MIFLNDKEVLLARYIGNKYQEIKKQLSSYHDKLLKMGYKVNYLEYDDEIIENSYFYLNGLIFKDGENRKVIIPSFPANSKNEKIIGKLTEIFKNKKIKVDFLEDNFFYKYNGGFHCVTNAIK